MKHQPLVSIIIPCFNAMNTLRQCLESVLNQSYDNLEILIIDDGSTDQSLELIEQYQMNDKRVHVICSNHKGVSNARNKGLQHVTGEYIQFVDSDDYLEERYTELLVKAIMKRKADWVICDYHQITLDNRDLDHVCLRPDFYHKVDFLKQLVKHPGAHYYGVLWNKLYRTNLIKKNHLYFSIETSMGEDFIFNMQYLSYVNKISCLEEKLYNYRWQQKDSLSNVLKNEKEKINERINMYQAYKMMFEREQLFPKWKNKIEYYIIKFYFDELEELEGQAKKYKKYLYQQCIKNCGIMPWEFFVFWILKKGKRLINTITKER